MAARTLIVLFTMALDLRGDIGRSKASFSSCRKPDRTVFMVPMVTVIVWCTSSAGGATASMEIALVDFFFFGLVLFGFGSSAGAIAVDTSGAGGF